MWPGGVSDKTRAERGSDALPRNMSARQKPCKASNTETQRRIFFSLSLLAFCLPPDCGTQRTFPSFLPLAMLVEVSLPSRFPKFCARVVFVFLLALKLAGSNFCLAQEIRHCQVTGHPPPIQCSGLTFVLLRRHYQCCRLEQCNGVQTVWAR